MNLNKQILEAIQRGINLAIDDFDDDMDIETQKVGQIKHSSNTSEMIIDKYFIDLGLPSGILWGKYNVGVNINKLNKAEDWYGGYYAWGEIEEKQNYDWETYKYANGYYRKLTKYCNNANFCDAYYRLDNLTTLQDEDDVAVQTNKLPWNVKMSTKEQFEELLKYTTYEWVINYQEISGLNGNIFTSKQNGNEIFIPAAGFRGGSQIDLVGSHCFLWSRSFYSSTPNYAYRLDFNSSSCGLYTSNRFYGASVRPVLIK